MAREKTHYEILGVPETASIEEIKKAYHELAKELHPDRNPGQEARMKVINKAHDVLSDDNKKKEYDQEQTATKASAEAQERAEQARATRARATAQTKTFGDQLRNQGSAKGQSRPGSPPPPPPPRSSAPSQAAPSSHQPRQTPRPIHPLVSRRPFSPPDPGSIVVGFLAWIVWCVVTATVVGVIFEIAGLADHRIADFIVVVILDVTPLLGLLVLWLHGSLLRR